MKLIKEILLSMIAVIGLSVAVSAQKKPDNPPPKNPPPVVKPGKPEKPPQKPQKPAYAFVESIVVLRNDRA